MMTSPPASPEVSRKSRPQSYYGSTNSPEPVTKSRPQSMMMMHKSNRSTSRMSVSSSRGLSRASDEDSRTSVKVAVRVRPPLKSSDPGFDLIPQRFQRAMVQVTTNTTLGVESPLGRKMFIFDRVFGAEVNQHGIYDYLQESVDSFLQGYNVSILAYGQSGAGKSYTMGTSGPQEQDDNDAKGVIPRAASHLFAHLNGEAILNGRPLSGLKTPSRYSVGNINSILQNGLTGGLTRGNGDKDWELSATYVEIYNEQPRDLLLPESTTVGERPHVQIREDAKGRIYVEGLKSVPVNTIEELLTVLNHGSTIRQTDATAINARSSRSHAVFTLTLKQRKVRPTNTPGHKRASASIDALTNGDYPVAVESKLHFVDLAGSERMKNTGATGDRAKEGISINAGLASLGKVISQLSSRSPGTHVSYRDSKLTRMLQDSLGGNAITYMIACITPAEFHLSETLNTVQYAQRARNIQTKPKIQQISDDADKQVTIDRLRTEIAFLRQQIRSAESGDNPRNGAETSVRSKEREVELQNHLLDVQESYNALSQRHAKIISDLAKSGHEDETTQQMTNLVGESAVDRLKRSQAHQEQIEQVVLEYEKTIQSLEANLSNTRTSLANTESNLLEKETKFAYVESVNSQLHTRLQKLVDREANTETYLRSLEARVDGQTTGDDKNNAVIEGLRGELTRLREGEVTAEDYISNLEERLAEADQDLELMQRECDRLEHVVERQRSLGKLDNLLYELDQVHKKSTKDTSALSNGISNTHADAALEELKEAEKTELPPVADDDLIQTPSQEREIAEGKVDAGDSGLATLQRASQFIKVARPGPASQLVQARDFPPTSPAQSKFVAEKFEAVSQELFDLRLEHESTMNELDLMSAKYQQALRTLAEMQDAADEARHPVQSGVVSPMSRPTSYAEGARMTDRRNGGNGSSSRSLSSELSSVGESPVLGNPSEVTPLHKVKLSPSYAYQEIDRLQHMLADHERGLNMVTQQYAELQSEHQDTLMTVETLKLEVQKNKSLPPPPSPSLTGPGMIRRMGSHQQNGLDRGSRSLNSLRGILAENFDDQPEKMEGAEVHLNHATQELVSRMERIQSLEAELKNARKEMDMKSTIITGLTRERNSLKGGSPVDLAIVGQMRDQLIQKESELKSMHDGYALREQELLNEMQTLAGEKERYETLSANHEKSVTDRDEKLRELQNRVEQLSGEHTSLESSAETFGSKLSTTNAELEAALATIATLKTQQQADSTHDGTSFERAAAANAMQTERDNYMELVEKLKQETEQLQSEKVTHLENLKNLEQEHAQARDLVLTHQEDIASKSAEIEEHKTAIIDLKAQIKEKESAVEFHKHGLKSLHETHANQLEEIKLSHAGAMADIDDQLTELMSKNDTVLNSHKSELARSKSALQDVMAGAQSALGHPTSPDMLYNHIQDVVEEKNHVFEANARITRTNAELERQLEDRRSLKELEEEIAASNSKMTNYQDTIRNLANEVANHEESLREKTEIIRKRDATIESINEEKKKKLHIIEELEQQLQSSFDQHHNRVSVITAQGNQALVEAQQRISQLEKEFEVRKSFVESDSRSNTMKSQIRPNSPLAEGQRANSLTSNLRKSNSVASLPSPPPSVPLPPLPSLPGISVAGPANNNANPSPPSSRHTSKEGPTLMSSSPFPHGPPTPTLSSDRSSRQIEDLEARLRTIEKHLHAEKQLTATLEEALVDLETQQNKVRADMESWKKKAWTAEEELGTLRKEQRNERLSVQVVEEEKRKRTEAEAARAHLEERMMVLSQERKKKKKGSTLNCF